MPAANSKQKALRNNFNTIHHLVMSEPSNPVVWFEIYVNDMARAKAFYEATFAITMEKMDSPDPSLEMWNFPMDMGRHGAGGAICKMEGCAAGGGGTVVYFTCKDCAVEESRVEPAGGKVIKSKFSIGPYGFISLVSDTEGNTIGLYSME